MAGSTTSIGILVEAQDRATATLKKVEEQLSDMSKKMDESSKSSDGFGASLKKLVTIGGAVAAAWKTYGFLKDSIKQFNEAEDAMFRLATVTNNTTGATEEQVQALFDQADALERVGVVSSSAILDAQAKLALYGLETKSIQALVPALLDMAVGQAGVSQASEAVIDRAQLLGKALQGNTMLLEKQGIAVSEAQKKILLYGDESERVATLNEILTNTYDGLNEAATKTSVGSLANLSNRLDALKENIGRQLTPTIGVFVSVLEDLFGVIDNNSGALTGFGRGLYQVTSFVFAAVESLKTLVISLTAVGDMIWSLGKMAASPFKALAQAISGDFEGAWDTLSTASTVAWDEVTQKAEAYGEQVVDSIDKVGQHMNKALSGEGFSTKFNLFGGKTSGAGGLSKEIDPEVKAVKEKLEELAGAYEDFSNSADDSLFELRQSHKQNIAQIKEQLASVRKEMAALQEEYNKTKASDTQDVAQQIIAEEEKIAEIQKEMQGDISQSRYDELKAELEKRQAAMQANSDFIASIQGAVDEARRVAGLTDLERAIEEFNARRAIATNEFNAKMADLEAEVKALKKKRKDEDELYEEKRQFIRNIEEEINKSYAEMTKNNLNITREAISKEIEYYKMLADAIKSARSGNAAEVGRIQNRVTAVNDAIISPKGDIITTHPDDYLIATKDPRSLGGSGVTVIIQGGTYIDPQSARKIGDEIIKALELQYKY